MKKLFLIITCITLVSFSAYADAPLQSTAPINNIDEVTPSDSTDLEHSGRSLYVTETCDIAIDTIGGDTVTLTDLASGVFHPIAVKRVYDTDTTCTTIFVGY